MNLGLHWTKQNYKPLNAPFGGLQRDGKMNVELTCKVVYGSYSQDDVKIVCDENDDLETIKGKIKKKYALNFLSMATYSVKVTDRKYLSYDY